MLEIDTSPPFYYVYFYHCRNLVIPAGIVIGLLDPLPVAEDTLEGGPVFVDVL